MTNTPQDNGWREEFDKEFLYHDYCGNFAECEHTGPSKCFHGIEDSMKEFISKVEQQAYDRAAEVAKNMILTIHDKDTNKSGIRNYNMACDDISTAILNLKDK